MSSPVETIPPSPVSSTPTPALANVLYKKKGVLAYVTVNRPKVLNALNGATWQELHTAFESAQNDASVLGVILTGAGDKAFIAGADISELSQATAIDAERSSRHGQEVLDLIENLGKPVVAAINGFALGAAVKPRWPVPSASLWSARIWPAGGEARTASRRWRHAAPPAARWQGPRAHSVRWNDRRAGGLPHRTRQRDRLGRRPDPAFGSDFRRDRGQLPLAVGYALDAVNQGMEMSQSEGLALEASYFGLCAGTEDKKEGTSAFLQKRPAQFHGR
jgi:enoyl-CoA hydratase